MNTLQARWHIAQLQLRTKSRVADILSQSSKSEQKDDSFKFAFNPFDKEQSGTPADFDYTQKKYGINSKFKLLFGLESDEELNYFAHYICLVLHEKSKEMKLDRLQIVSYKGKVLWCMDMYEVVIFTLEGELAH